MSGVSLLGCAFALCGLLAVAGAVVCLALARRRSRTQPVGGPGARPAPPPHPPPGPAVPRAVPTSPPRPPPLRSAAPAGSPVDATTLLPAVSRPRLSWLSGPLAGRSDVLPEGGLWIGREPPAQVVLPLSAISRLHLWIGVQHGELMLVDDKSSNGTFVDGQRVTRRAVRSGDLVWLAGDVASFRIEGGASP